jgi:hypothetical protein
MPLQPSPELVDQVSRWDAEHLLSAALLSTLWITFWIVRYLLKRDDKSRVQLTQMAEAVAHSQNIGRLMEKLTEYIAKSGAVLEASKERHKDIMEATKAYRELEVRLRNHLSSGESSGGSSSQD